MNADGSGAVNLTNDEFNNVYPGWTPEGRVIYGQGVKGQPTTKVFTVDADGKNKRALLSLDSFYARYSPDGAAIAYIAPAGAEGARIMIVGKDGAVVATVSLEGVASDR